MRLVLTDSQPLKRYETSTVDPAASRISTSETERPTAHAATPSVPFGLVLTLCDKEPKGVSTFTSAVDAINYI